MNAFPFVVEVDQGDMYNMASELFGHWKHRSKY